MNALRIIKSQAPPSMVFVGTGYTYLQDHLAHVAQAAVRRLPRLALLLFCLAYLLPGWATGAAFRLPLPEGFWPEAGVVTAAIAVLLGLSLNSSLRGHRRATLWIGCASLTLLIALFIGYPHLNDFDQGLSALVQEHRSAWLDEHGHLYLSTDLGAGLVHTQDVWRAAECIEQGRWPAPGEIDAHTLPARFGFVPSPAAVRQA